MKRRLHVFDVDNTIISDDSSHLWIDYMIRRNLIDDPERCRKEERRFAREYREGVLDIHEYIAFYTDPVRHLSEDLVRSLAEDCIKQCVADKIYPEIPDLFARLREEDAGIMLLSATSETVVLPLARHLGIDEDFALCVRLERENGCYSPKIRGTPTFREGKLQVFKEWLRRHDGFDPDFSFYSDSINDLPMLEAASCAHAVNPDAALRRIAEERGWSVEFLSEKKNI